MNDDESATGERSWRGKLFFREGLLMYAGPVGPTDLHAHHAFQIIHAAEPGLKLADENANECDDVQTAVIPPDVPHAFLQGSMRAMLLYLDPDGHAGRRLRRAVVAHQSGVSDWVRAGEPLARNAARMPRTWDEAMEAASMLLEGLIGPTPSLQIVHPGVRRVLRALQEEKDLGSVRVAALAATAGLSSGRLIHVFSSEVGIPMRRYMLWLRLQRAAATLERGGTLTEAAYEAGFADGAHLTRVFRRMFGIRPSEVAGWAEWVQRPDSR